MKKFNFFEKLWEHGRTLRRVGLVLVMCLMAIPQLWATSGIKLRGDYVGGFSYTSDTWTKGVNGDETKRYWDVYHSGGSKFWRIWLVYYNHDGGPDNENEDYDLNEGDYAYMVVNKNKHSFVTTADPGILRIKVDQYGSDKGRSKDEYPYVWVERPDVEFKYPWDGITWTKVTATDNHDGTYTYRGTYRGVDRFNAGPNGADKIAPEGTGEGTTVIIGSPTTGRRCEFKWQPGTGDPNTDYKYTGGEEDNRGRFTITKLCTITYYANGGTGDAPDLQEVLYGADQTLRGNTGGLSKDGYVFVGWNTNSSGTGDHYDVGATLEDVEADVDLYAEWVSGKWGVKGKGGDGALGSDFETFHVLRKISTNKYKGSVSLGAHQVYEFKITDNTTWYGKADISRYFLGQTNSVTLATGGGAETNCIIATGNAGDYTFEFDESTGGLIVTYPNGNNHPSTNFVYYSNPNSWGTIKAYIYDNPELTNWNNSPILGTPVTISGQSYYYTALGDRKDVIFHNGSGNQTSDLDDVNDEVGHYYNTSWAQFTVRITLNNQSATSAGTEYKDVKFNYDELTTSITCPTKTGYNFGGYYTETNGGGVQIINASGVWQASVSGYTDGDKKWIKDGGTATLYAKWTEKTYSVTAAVNPAGSGFVTPSSATTFGQVVGGDITASPNGGYDFYKWSVTSGSGTIDDDDEASTTFYPTATSTVTAQFCPATGSGETVFKFTVKSDVADGNVCSSSDAVNQVVGTHLSELEGGTMSATSSTNTNLKFKSGAYQFNGGSAGLLTITLSCPLKEGDIIKYVNSAASTNAVNFCHTSKDNGTDKIELVGNGSSTAQYIKLPAGYEDKSVIYLSRGSSATTLLKSIEIIRPYSITLDANTNGGTVNGEETIEVTADGFTYFPRAVKSGYRFKGWYTASSGGTLATEPYLSTDGATLYAQFEDCPASGTMFSLGSMSSSTAKKVPACSDASKPNYMDLRPYATIVGGAAYSGNNHTTNAKGGVTNSNQINIDGVNAFVRVDLDCALAEGDKISVSAGADLCVTTSYPRDDTYTITKSTDFVCPAAFEDATSIYIWKKSSDTQITAITITRPAPVSTFDVTIASNNTDYGDVYVKSLNDVESGTTISTSDNELTIGETVITATPETSDAQYTYTFTGWTDDEGEDLPSTVTADLSILANFEQTTNTYAITWKNYDGTTLETDAAVEYGATPSYDGDEPTKSATAEYTYAFDEWDPAVASVTGDATYTATFTQTANNYTLAWDKNGSGDALSGSYTSGTTAYGTTLTAPNTPTWSGHRFDGWNTKANGSGDAYTGTMPAADTKYYAQWTVLHDVTITATNVTKSTGAATAAEGENYVATFSTVTGYDLPTSVAVKIGDDAAVLSTDYTWSAGTLTVLAASVTDDITITVTGEAQTYTISYKDKGGSDYSGSNLASLPTSHTYGTATDFVNGVKANYTFDGWFTDSGCESSAGSSIGATAITSNTTYYAKWTAKTAPTQYAVTIDAATVCSGSTTNIKMAESQSGVSYQLYKGEDKVDDAKAGGSALTWSSISATGTYKVMAVENATYASRDMSNTVTLANYDAVSIKTHPTSAIAATIGVGSDMSVVLNTGTFNNAAYTWQTCTDATPSSASDISSGSQYSNYNTATMTFTPSSAGTYYFRCKVTDDCGTTVYSNVTTVTATDGPCFTMTANTSAKSNGSLSHNESIAEGSDNCSDLDGGTAKYVDAGASNSMTVDKSMGWKFHSTDDQIIVTLSAGYYLQEGSVITMSGHANASSIGIQINGKNVYTKPSSSGDFTNETYTVLSTDEALLDANILTIKRHGGSDVYLSSISISGCNYCEPITPTLTYDKTTFWLDEDDVDLWCSPTLNKNGSTGTVTYTSSNSDIVWVGSSTGNIHAARRGTATITASIAADGTHCAAEATCKIIVKSIECSESVIAKATLSGTDAASDLTGGTLIASNLKSDAPHYKLNKAGAKFGITISGSFCLGDSIIFGGKMDANATTTSFWIFPNDTATTAVSAIYTATLSNSDSIDAKFVVTEDMLSALNNSKKVCVIRQTAINQNPHMKFVRIKRYACPDILIFNDADNDGSWTNADNWIGKSGQGTGLPKDTDRVYIKKSVSVDATTATAGRVHIVDGAVMTVEKSVTMVKVDVETGSTLHVAKDGDDGVTLELTTLYLKGGWNDDKTKYDMPRVYINSASSLTKTNNTVNFDISVNHWNYYPIALPFDVPLNSVDYARSDLASISDYGMHYAIYEYDGQKRANYGGGSNNWKYMNSGSTLKAGKGYILSAITDGGKAIIRFPMTFTDAWTAGGEKGEVEDEDPKNVITITAYENNIGGETSLANKGWNLIGVPYMSCYTTGSGMYTGVGTAALIEGRFDYETGKWTEKDANFYVTVPTHDFTEFKQSPVGEAVLMPGWCFFVQVEETGNLLFLDGQQASSSSAIYEAPRREMSMPTLKTGIILSGNEASDQTTILVSDRYSASEYEINADLEKMFGETGYTLATYSLSGETRLAYNALSNAEAANIIPIGYRAPADGDYTFSINPRYAQNGAFESVNLIDYETGIVTDLLLYSYTFTTTRTQNDARFALNIVKRQDTTTDIENGASEANGVRKLIINDQLYIILDGKMYDATGKAVK